MMPGMIKSKKIGELLEQEPGYGLALHQYGISLFAESGLALEEACAHRNLDTARLVQSLEEHARERSQNQVDVASYPIDLVMAYLRHAHGVFIKERLPYLLYLVRGLNVTDEAYKTLAQDLKVVFPLFAQDFIEHIFEEEDTLFTYIKTLLDASKGKVPRNAGHMWLTMERRSISHFSSGHEQHDDEMEGIRKLTDGYTAQHGMEPALHVLFYELRCFEADLITHAAVENHILFPRALRLEGYVRTQLNGLARWN